METKKLATSRTEAEIMEKWEGNIDEPVVSICCITYNHEPYIEDALEGFLMQETDFPFEILIHDDASLDKTARIINLYQKKYPNIIKPVIQEENQYSKGIDVNRIFNINRAKAKYIALCEGDDYWVSENKLYFQKNAMEEAAVHMSFHQASSLMSDGKLLESKLDYDEKIYSVNDLINVDFHFVQTNTIMFVKTSLSNIHESIFNKSPIGDVLVKIATSLNTGALCINENFSVYRVQALGSWTSKNKEDNVFLGFVEVMLNTIDDLDKYFNYKFNKEFEIYKVKFIKVLIERTELDKKKKTKLIKKYWNNLDFKSKVKFYLFSSPIFVSVINLFYYLKKLKIFLWRRGNDSNFNR